MKVKYQAFLLNWIAENEQNPHIHKYKMLSRLLEGEFKHSANIPRFVFDGERILQKLYRENTPQHIEATIDLCSDGEADIDLEAPDDKLPKNSFKNEPLNQKHVDKPEEESEVLPLINPSEGQQPDLPKSPLDPNEQNNVCSSQLPSNIENEATVTLTSDAEMQDEPRASGLNNETKIQYFDHKDEVELEFEPESIMSTINAVEKTQESNILPPAQEDNVDPHSLSSLHIAEVEPVPARKNSSNKARRPSCAAKSAFGSLQKCTIKKNVLKPAWIYANSKKSQEVTKTPVYFPI